MGAQAVAAPATIDYSNITMETSMNVVPVEPQQPQMPAQSPVVVAQEPVEEYTSVAPPDPAILQQPQQPQQQL